MPAHHPARSQEVPCADLRPTRPRARPKLTFIAGLMGFSVALAIGEVSQSLGPLVAARAAQLAARCAADDVDQHWVLSGR
jgi:hypothetical protein